MAYGNLVDELERCATMGHYKSATESRGLCFQATLALGHAARQLGLQGQVAFVRWSVRRDVNFLEHWALLLGDGRVLDMTAVQVDGNPDPLRRLAGYPANYVRPRQYPAAIVLAVMDRHVQGVGRSFSRRLLWVLHRQLFRHDAGHALRARSPLALTDAVAELLRRAATLCAGYLLERAVERMSGVLLRLK